MIEALAAEGQTTAALLESLYEAGLMPDFWLVETPRQASDAEAINAVISRHDPACRGLIVIARTAASGPELALAAAMPRIIGFVGGRAIFGDVLKGWLDGALDDTQAVSRMAERFGALSDAFDDGRSR
jgi:5-dehydro-2-deoxygluconokinase